MKEINESIKTEYSNYVYTTHPTNDVETASIHAKVFVTVRVYVTHLVTPCMLTRCTVGLMQQLKYPQGNGILTVTPLLYSFLNHVLLCQKLFKKSIFSVKF